MYLIADSYDKLFELRVNKYSDDRRDPINFLPIDIVTNCDIIAARVENDIYMVYKNRTGKTGLMSRKNLVSYIDW